MTELINKYGPGVRAELDHRLMDPSLDALASMYGSELPQGQERISALQEIAANNWDFRKGAERQAVQWDTAELSDPMSPHGKEIFRHTARLGMVAATHPSLAGYDKLVVTGAANTAPWDRLRYAVEQNIDFQHVVMLGSTRPVSEAERKNTQEYAPEAMSEFDLMCGAVEKVFSTLSYSDSEVTQVGYQYDAIDANHRPLLREYETGNGRRVSVLRAPAPSGEARNRANTQDTYTMMREVIGVEPESDVLFSTNAFYAPFQHIDSLASLALTTGAHVETIGFDAAYSGKVRLPNQLLQETKSYIDAMARLDNTLRSASM